MGRRIDLETARRLVADAKKAGKRVVLANGCFDLIHVGHVRYLEGSKAAGDLLVVAVNGDRSVAALKGPDRPFMNAAERVELVASMQAVDLVIVFEEETVASLIETLRPDIHCKGTDYTEQTVPEREEMKRIGGVTKIVGDPKNHSTRDLIGLLRERFQKS